MLGGIPQVSPSAVPAQIWSRSAIGKWLDLTVEMPYGSSFRCHLRIPPDYM